jgi:hypothetical protein
MTEIEPWDEWTLQAMRRFGGGFVQALAVAYRAADDDNRRLLRAAFDDKYGPEYRKFGAAMKAQEADTLNMDGDLEIVR